ncbi:MAG TPA: PEP-CTERM sorting domain-containing protein [Humisphaera sp.]
MAGGLVFAAAVAATADAGAAVLTGSVTTTAPANVNLTSEGTIDWAIWDYQAGTAGTSGVPSNRKSGGSAIGTVTAVLGTPRGITGTLTPPTYTYTNGTSPASATGATIGAITDTSINAVGSGVRLNISGDPTKVEVVRLYVAGFNAVGTLSAQLNGATTYVDSSASYGGNRTGSVYTLSFQPNTAADQLQVSYTIQSLNTGGNANVDLQAVTVGVPEPAGAGLLAVAAAGFLTRRRRRVNRCPAVYAAPQPAFRPA